MPGRHLLLLAGLGFLAHCSSDPPALSNPAGTLDASTPLPTIDAAAATSDATDVPEASPPVDATATPTCSDGTKGGTESDVDCGGSCKKCGAGRACASAADCKSGVCSNGDGGASLCQATCTDGEQNGDETDVDCGGGTCKKCPAGARCTGNTDCKGGACAAPDGGPSVCAPTCADDARNGSETDVDCGGSCGPCETGQECLLAADCSQLSCVSKVCQLPSCIDGVKNGAETAVDCGGSGCKKCVDGLACLVASDCKSGQCDALTCVSCADGKKNGAETDIDCGGGTCKKCKDGDACKIGDDCGSSVCASEKCDVPLKSAMLMWLQADAITGLADGAAVAAWSDVSGKGNHTAQATLARQPTYRTGILAGKPVVRFDGADDALAIVSTQVVSTFAVFVVYRLEAGATAPGTYYPFALGGNVNVTGTYYGFETLNAAAGTSANSLDIIGGFGNDHRATATNISAFGQWKIISVVTNGSTHKSSVRVNGVDATMTTTGSDVAYSIPLGTAAGTGWGGIGGIGTSYGGPSIYAMKGDIAEFMVLDHALTTEERDKVEAWLNAKYSVF